MQTDAPHNLEYASPLAKHPRPRPLILVLGAVFFVLALTAISVPLLPSNPMIHNYIVGGLGYIACALFFVIGAIFSLIALVRRDARAWLAWTVLALNAAGFATEAAYLFS